MAVPGRHVHGRAGSRSASSGVGAPWPGLAGGSPGRAEGGGVLGASPVTWRETGRVNPSRCGSSAQASGARRRTPSPRVGVAPHLSTGCLHRSGTDRRGRAVLVRTDDGPERRLHPLAADPSGAAHDGRSTGTRPRWSRSSRGSARVPAAASSRPSVLERAPLVAERVLRTASRSHGVSGWPCVLPRPLTKSINSFSVVAPVVMWAGRRAVQGPGVGRRPSPGRHVHGRGARGARGGALAVALLGRGGPAGLRGALTVAGFCGACPVRWRETALPIPIAADPRRRESARGADSLRLGWVCPLPGRSTGTRWRWPRSVSGSAPRPGGCVLSR